MWARMAMSSTPAPAAEEDDSDWSSSAEEAPAPAPFDDDDDVSIVSVSSATAEDASERLSRAEGYAERYPAKAAKVLRPCITAWRGGAPIDYASNPDAGPVIAVSCCYAYARCTANVAVQDGACGENSPALVADALEALDQALELDPAAPPLLAVFMHFKGFLGLQTHRAAASLWARGADAVGARPQRRQDQRKRRADPQQHARLRQDEGRVRVARREEQRRSS